MLIDTHCHLDFKDFDRDRDEVIERARRAGVARIVNVGSSIEGTRRSLELAEKYDIVYATIGIHPHDARSATDEVLDGLRALAAKKKVVAVGEVGLDYYRNLSPREIQIDVFRKFIRLAAELKLPLILHSRDANDETLEVLRTERQGPVRGVMHCFSGESGFLKECLDLGLFVSFTCNLTFKNAGALRDVARQVPVERLLLETDAPFLAPQDMRGKRNESSYLAYLVNEWTRITGLSADDIARITTHNAQKLFSLDIEEPTRIAYPIRDSIYLNITNRCTNTCDFCVRSQTSFVKGHNLRLEREPSSDEIIEAIGDPACYKEVVFCGYGEPTLRLDVIKEVSRSLKEKGMEIRLVTNGHGDLIHGRPVAKELAGVIDKVSVSLNAETEEKYSRICIPDFGPRAYVAVVSFIRECVANGIETEVTCLDLPGVDIKACESIARSLGASFRLRSYGVVG